MQKERERADALAQDLSMARTKIYAYEAQAAKASEEAAQLKQAQASDTARAHANDALSRARIQAQTHIPSAARDANTSLGAAGQAI